ncbi:hypothetical protein EN839_34120, partial [Mesorhizobium sp. M1C.F.Ca.ET.196.01.1.1]|uniref:hypothetical protein n=1 Tax=Mesorhizobium sp. M1C.F.Ca.ET.196.01.1.1 TaxID=2563928 RepID=UPI001092EC6E
ARDLALEIPPVPLEAVMPNEVWERVYDRLAELVALHRTTLVFAHTAVRGNGKPRSLTSALFAESKARLSRSVSSCAASCGASRTDSGAAKAGGCAAMVGGCPL